MPELYEVTYITKSNRAYPPERVRILGGIYPTGEQWRLSQGEAIAAIESGQFAFFIRAGDARFPLKVDSYEGVKYIRADGPDANDRFLSLPECR